MTHHWDEFSKSLVEQSVPRRESLRLLGAAMAGALLSPFGLTAAWAATPDPCKTFCRCGSRWKQNQCLAACRACNSDVSRLCGSCGNYFCCGEYSCCGSYCADLASDVNNCGACGARCAPGYYEHADCIDGVCIYRCVTGAVDCYGTCTNLLVDPDNCGACGNVCPESAPYCQFGICHEDPCPFPLTMCGDRCVNLNTDWWNCGACGHACFGYDNCVAGLCENTFYPIPE